MDILIFSGQSNMQGSTGEPDKREPVENALEYRFRTDEMIPLANPVGEEMGGEARLLEKSDKGNGSLVPDFCRAYVKATGRKVLAVHVARGGTEISEWMPGTERFRLAVEKVEKAFEAAKRTEEIGRVALVWLQGESDAISETGTEKYLSMLTEFKNAWKEKFPIETFAIIRQGYFSAFAPWVEQPFFHKLKCDREIMKAFDLAPERDGDFTLLTRIAAVLSLTPWLLNHKEHGPHYNNRGMKILGTAAGKALAKRLK